MFSAVEIQDLAYADDRGATPSRVGVPPSDERHMGSVGGIDRFVASYPSPSRLTSSRMPPSALPCFLTRDRAGALAGSPEMERMPSVVIDYFFRDQRQNLSPIYSQFIRNSSAVHPQFIGLCPHEPVDGKEEVVKRKVQGTWLGF
jgi:hypothetical protein